MVEEQCEVVAEENWGSFVHLTVDGQNNVIFLDDGQVGAAEAVVADGETTTVVIESEPVPQRSAPTTRRSAASANRQRVAVAAPKTKVTRRSAAAAAAAGNASPNAASSSGEVDLLSFVHNAGVMVQHILDIQSDNSAS